MSKSQFPKIITKDKLTFYFIGVTTGKSSACQMFPLWMEALGRPEVVLKGLDLPIHAEPEHYRQVVAHIKQNPLVLGALVTTHKIDLLEAARNLFDDLGPYARICNEVSCISKANGRLIGQTSDPIAGGLSLDAILGTAYFARTGAEVLCLGAGGAGTAICLHLINKTKAEDQPSRIVVLDRLQSRLDRLQRMVKQQNSVIPFDYHWTQKASENNAFVADLRAGSLVINASGLGKDRAGSPLTEAAIFPENGIAWELNYRGTLNFKQQALAQKKSRNLRVEDGWLYFIHGWSQVISKVLHLTIDDDKLNHLSALAKRIR